MEGLTATDLIKLLQGAEHTIRVQDRTLVALRKKQQENEAVINEMQEQFRLATEANQRLNDIVTKLSESPERGPRTSTAAWSPTKEQLARHLKEAERTVRLQFEQIQQLHEREWQQRAEQLLSETAQAEEALDEVERQRQQEAEARERLQDAVDELRMNFIEPPRKEEKECSCKRAPKLQTKIKILTKELEIRTAQLSEAVANCMKEKLALEESLRAIQEELNTLQSSADGVLALENDLEQQHRKGSTNQQLTQEIETAREQITMLQNEIKELKKNTSKTN